MNTGIQKGEAEWCKAVILNISIQNNASIKITSPPYLCTSGIGKYKSDDDISKPQSSIIIVDLNFRIEHGFDGCPLKLILNMTKE